MYTDIIFLSLIKENTDIRNIGSYLIMAGMLLIIFTLNRKNRYRK